MNEAKAKDSPPPAIGYPLNAVLAYAGDAGRRMEQASCALLTMAETMRTEEQAIWAEALDCIAYAMSQAASELAEGMKIVDYPAAEGAR